MHNKYNYCVKDLEVAYGRLKSHLHLPEKHLRQNHKGIKATMTAIKILGTESMHKFQKKSLKIYEYVKQHVNYQ